MTVFTHSVYTLILALWVGGISIFTFIVTPEIFRSFSRDEAGKIVGKLFPDYFLFTLALSVLVLLVLPLCRSIFGQAGGPLFSIAHGRCASQEKIPKTPCHKRDA